MRFIYAFIAGLIQGATEFLPVSSSGHLIIFYTLVGADDNNLSFTVFLHLATLLSICFVFRGDILSLFNEIVMLTRRAADKPEDGNRSVLLLLTATIPAFIVGVLIKLLNITDFLDNIFVVGAMLLLTAALLFKTDRFKDGGITEKDASYKSALIIGLIQAAAIMPGLSRSGATIFGGRLCGFTKDFAVKFAFLLSIPVILGAGLVEFIDLYNSDLFTFDPAWLLGFIAASVSGIFAIKFINILVRAGKLYIFGVYCVIAAIAAFITGFLKFIP